MSQSPYKGFNRFVGMNLIKYGTESQSPYKGFNRLPHL